MLFPGKGLTDRQAEQLVGRILQIGVLLSALVVSAGGILYLTQNAGKPAGHHEFHREPERLRNPVEVVQQAVGLHPRAVMQLGVLLLDPHAGGAGGLYGAGLPGPAGPEVRGRDRFRAGGAFAEPVGGAVAAGIAGDFHAPRPPAASGGNWQRERGV